MNDKTREKSCDLTLVRVFEKREVDLWRDLIKKTKRKRPWYVEHKRKKRDFSS